MNYNRARAPAVPDYGTSSPDTAASSPSTNSTESPSFPSTFGLFEGAARTGTTRRRSRCCLCVTFTVIPFILLAAVSGGLLYAIYRPHRPSFSLSSIQVQNLNLTSSNTLDANLTLAVVTTNPNKGVVFYYDPTTVTVTTDGDRVTLGAGSFPSFKLGTKNTTVIKAAVVGTGLRLDDLSVGMPLKIKVETKVKVKMGALKSPKVMIRVSCEGLKATMPAGKTLSLGSSPGVNCKIDWRIKIWKLVL